MNYLDAAYDVLKRAGKPLHYTEITQRALAAGILDTKGQTPQATMGSRLYVDTKRPNSRFKRVNRNLFTLAGNQPSEISQRIAEINQLTRDELHRRLMQMPPDRFEALIGELLLALGFDEEHIRVTTYGGDGGIDVRGVLRAGGITEVNAAVQVKRWKSNIQAPVVQALRGSLVVHEQGIIITTSRFSKGAIQEAQAPGKMRISLVDGEQLLSLLVANKIGIKTEQHAVYTIDDEWWGDIISTVESQAVTVVPASAPLTQPAINYPLHIEAVVKGVAFVAELLDSNGAVQMDGKLYGSPSTAGQVATGWKSCNGWMLWRYLHPESGKWCIINELRSTQKMEL